MSECCWTSKLLELIVTKKVAEWPIWKLFCFVKKRLILKMKNEKLLTSLKKEISTWKNLQSWVKNRVLLLSKKLAPGWWNAIRDITIKKNRKWKKLKLKWWKHWKNGCGNRLTCKKEREKKRSKKFNRSEVIANERKNDGVNERLQKT